VPTESQPLPRAITWPLRALAVVVIVPFRLLWEGGRLAARYVLEPILRAFGWLFEHLLARPVSWLGRWVWRLVLRPLGRALVVVWRWIAPAVWAGLRLLGRAIAVVWRAIPWRRLGELLYRWVLRPVGRAMVWAWRTVGDPVVRAIGWVLEYLIVRPVAFVWRYAVVVPVGFVWRYAVVVPLGFVWRSTVAPAGRWVRDAVLRPAARTVRRVFAAF
jgi:hypothetical protein